MEIVELGLVRTKLKQTEVELKAAKESNEILLLYLFQPIVVEKTAQVQFYCLCVTIT